MSQPAQRYQHDLQDDGKSGYRPSVPRPTGCPGPDQCRERTGGAVLAVLALVAVLGVTIGLITGCQIGYAQAKAHQTEPRP